LEVIFASESGNELIYFNTFSIMSYRGPR